MNWDIVVQCSLSGAVFLLGGGVGVVVGAFIAFHFCRSVDCDPFDPPCSLYENSEGWY